ncbi:hypothetical protein A1Q1_07793 [Trichosporon asahii var. asahii CBS 2479]|uniref:Ubiquitin-like protein ATG12 n=1 Tax=Trichosporon asahii var. asahii (strain ATCC 90039 / CBS 2479 / JCM 2466 / KCTC 7840 / NBRC 103889/ NCYC 2677 / UAMH 7654) TaxID=1186058 RepID=J6F229_TRIAS|nr:hypothetical protein A1Q1_07793 [Trichosporon asahii var. asahii CBS 2479]EJT50999.1 hypothetical protein A1Q1_07793 [Trichosporon asahii var. asahii CBS 2479]
MKNNVFKVTAGNKFQSVIVFLRGQLGIKQSDALFTYINGAFAPTPDDTVGSLYKCFGTEGHLIVNYSLGDRNHSQTQDRIPRISSRL